MIKPDYLSKSGFNGHYPYDIECLPNFFSLICYRIEDGAKWQFEISPRVNQGRELYIFLTQIRMSNGRMIGFNNLAYDYPMLHTLCENQGVVNNTLLYNKSQAVIHAFNEYEHWIWERDRYVPQIDLYRIHHFDNKAKRTSLKILEFNMLLEDIVELDVDWNAPLPSAMAMDQTLYYNDNDVKATAQFAVYSETAIAFRDELSEKYGRDFTNFNDTKIGEEITKDILTKAGVRVHKSIQTIRDRIDLGEVILPYVRLEHPAFQEITEFFRSTVMHPESIKGFFGSRDKSKTKCTAKITERLAQYMDPNDVTVYYTDGTKSTYAERNPSKTVKHMTPVNIHCVINGFRFDFGAGGIHGSVSNRMVIPTEGQILKDTDVEGYYPSLSIANGIYPKHIGPKWCDAMEFMKVERNKVGKKTAMGQGYKLGGNGAYGKSNDKHSFIYDPQYTMAITINGQLTLCMLAEQLLKIPGLELVQANTDGITYIYPKEYDAHVNAVLKWWEELTKLKLEHVDYIRMAVRDVNSYIAVTKPYTDKDGKLVPPKVKRIGAYAYERASENESTRELPWHKNHGGIVIAKAAEAAIVRGDNIERFIREHVKTNPMDFMMRTKINRSDWLYYEYDGARVETQRVCRYYASNDGGYLIKVMEPTSDQVKKWQSGSHWRHIDTGAHKMSAKRPSGKWVPCPPPSSKPPMREIGQQAGQKITLANTLRGLDLSNLDVQFYVNEARKLVEMA